MGNSCQAHRRRRLRVLTPFCLALAIPSPALASVDLNGNGLSDIWELAHNASSLAAEGDADGDGFRNSWECIAGTDPFEIASVPKLRAEHQSGVNLVISLPAVPGKKYQLESIQPSQGEPWTNWVFEASLVHRVGTVASFIQPATATTTFYLVAVSDVDTDNDGVNDWEEYRVGLDPTKPESNGQLDGEGAPLGDYAYVTGRLAVQDMVTLVASDPSATQPEGGATPMNLGQLTLTRAGFPLNALNVNLGLASSGLGGAVEGLDHQAMPRSVFLPPGASSQSIALTPLANPNLAAPVVATAELLSGSGYRVGTPRSASVVIYPSVTPAGSGLVAEYYTNSSATYSNGANFDPANLALTRVDPVVDFNWSNSTVLPFANSGYYSVRWRGQVQPEYSETYYFVANTDDGVKLWVNDKPVIDTWRARAAADSIGTITLQGGVRYNLRLEYFNGGGQGVARLYWYSPSQPKQIIPARRLYPVSSQTGPMAVTSPVEAVAFLGRPFSFTLSGANSPLGFTASGLPPGLVFNPANGMITGTPNVAGDFQVMVAATNSTGTGASVLQIRVFDTGSSVTREVWSGVPGTNISDIPLSTAPSSINTLGTLEGIADFGDNYGERIRGHFTAPVTGNYYFWIAGTDSAELWISNDSEPANKVRRAWVSPGFSTGPRQWTVRANQRSPWLALVAGERYYLEILHKAGEGTGDHWSVGWRQDDTGTNFNPGGVVPGYVLSRYYPPPPSAIQGTLYKANVLAQAGANSTGAGSATLRVSADGSQAVLSLNYSGLTAPMTGRHIHSDPYLNSPGQIIFDIDDAMPQPDGTLIWDIVPVGTLSAADILEIIREGKAYVNVHTVNYPAGEISGHFTLANGTQTFTPPPPPPAWTDDHANPSAAARFLSQATFGASPAEVAAVQSLGYEGWMENQFTIPATLHLPAVLGRRSANPTTPYPTSLAFNSWWEHSITAPDQLRQRVAFALSEIMVVSGRGILLNNARALSDYYDTLLEHSFGNFRELLEAVTLSPAMGIYLDMRGNSKGSMVTGIHPNENYAREILQLFSIGVNRMWPDGSPVMDSRGSLVPTYNQSVIMGFSSTFTGWNYYQSNQPNGRLPTNFSPPSNYTNPMVLVPSRHELGTKLLLDNVMLPQAWGSQADAASPNFDAYCSNDLEQALDSIFNHQNVGPFICRQLIQRLVTSHPSRDYIYRVVQVFNDNGSGVRGDMRAVVKAILLDYEARSRAVAAEATFGKQREPLLRATAVARAFPPPVPMDGTYSQSGSRAIAVTTANAHRLNNGDTVFLSFTDGSGQPAPGAQGYSVTVTSPTRFTINDPALSAGTYTQRANTTISNMVTAEMIVTNVITVSISNHGLTPGKPAYLNFISGGASNGQYQVIWSTNNSFAVSTPDTNNLSGNAVIARLAGGGYIQRGTTNTVSLPTHHGLKPGDLVYINFTAGTAADGTYTVVTVPDEKSFRVTAATSANQTINGATVYPLLPHPLVRSGASVVRLSTWSVGSTDGSLTQTPLYSPTVFNYFFPDYMFPGALAAAGLTTPEFQLTSDTEAALQMNFFAGGLLNNTGNTNGLSSFSSGNGAMVLDLGPWMTPAQTANAGIPSLVDAVSSLLTGGTLSPAAKNTIVAYVANTANFPYSATPTATQMRDRVRAVVHLIVTSPDFIIQR